jgi:hypothetical protein
MIGLSEDALTVAITKAREKFVDLGQEPLDGCSMERFIARELLAQIDSLVAASTTEPKG